MSTSAKEMIKDVLRPIWVRRKWFEKVRYARRPLLSPEAGNAWIADLVKSGKPASCGKLGVVELRMLRLWQQHKDAAGHLATWTPWKAEMLKVNAGVYPTDPDTLSKWAAIFEDAITQLDGSAIYFNFGEYRTLRSLSPNFMPMDDTAFEGFYFDEPWTQHLAGKRLLVATPFASTVEAQSKRLPEIWAKHPKTLFDVHVETIRVPLSAGISTPEYPTWVDGLNAMKREMESKTFDALFVGAGAWSVPLAAHAKRLGKFAIHLGGATQLMFGIKGGRWDDNPRINRFFTDAWVRPGPADRPKDAHKVEKACYW
jgi:hypothetical protein